MVSGNKEKGFQMTTTITLQMTKERLRAIRLAAGMTDDVVRVKRGKVQVPDGSLPTDFKGRKFSRHHQLRAA
jgi:hypothetical protein